MNALNQNELEYLFEKIHAKHKIDLFNYAQASLERRLQRFLSLHFFNSLNELTEKICSDNAFFEFFVKEITVNTTEMFRDAEAWKQIRDKVLPLLSELPSIRIWHAGCSSGEEIYSMWIILKETGLDNKVKVIASDLNREVIETAKAGTYARKSIELNEDNYRKSGGITNFSDYYTMEGTVYKMDPELIRNVKFIRHDLSSGSAFSKFDIILCRNVLIYFNKNLQEKVFTLFRESLFKKGFVVIGKKESMSYFSKHSDYIEFDSSEKIYRLKQ